MKKKLFALGMATAIAITGASPVSAAWSQKEKIEPTQKTTIAMWTETYGITKPTPVNKSKLMNKYTGMEVD